MFKLRRLVPDTIRKNEEGKEVLTKTEDFQLYIIRNVFDDVLGTVLLTEAQSKILNESCNAQGIKFTTK